MKGLIIILVMGFSIFANSTEIPLNAAKGSIAGIIIDKNLNKPVEYANVVIYKKADSTIVNGTISGLDGSFRIENLSEGDYFLTADFLGYNKFVVPAITISKENKIVDLGIIKIQQAIELINEVEVVGEKNYVDYKIDKKVVNVSQHINAAGGTAAQVLENVPSVNVDMEGNVSLRGSQSFTVLIDGKPSIIPGNEVLKQIPASDIENIEIITNPSAKYDPDGTSGIINLVMKKNRDNGLNGLVSANVGTWNKFGGNTSFNLKKEKINYFLSASYNKSPRNMFSWEDRVNTMTDTILNLKERSERVQTFRPWNVNAGVDYNLNSNNLITVSGGIGSYGFFRDFETKYEAWTNPSTSKEYTLSENYFLSDGLYYSGTISYRKSFSKQGHVFETSINAWKWDGEQKETSDEYTSSTGFDNAGSYMKLRTLSTNIRDNLRIKADYTLPIKAGKFETGLLAHLNPGTSDFVFENYDSDAMAWKENAIFTNSTNFKRNIYSAYSMYSNQYKKLGYQLGIRGEYTDRLIEQLTTGEDYEVEIFNYYPTFALSMELAKGQQLQAGYSRRINRPQPWELNPYPNYSDSYNYSEGNPYLRPEDIDSYEFNYIKRLKKGMFSGGLYYRLTHDTKVMHVEIDEVNRLYLTYQNLDNTESAGTELMINRELGTKFSLNLGGNLYYYRIKGFLSGSVINQTSYNYDGRLSFSYKINPLSRLQLTGMYTSPSAEIFGTRHSNYVIGLAFRKDIIKRKGTLVVNISDVLASSEYRITKETQGYHSEISFKGESPIVSVSFSYRINNYQRRHQEQIDLGVGAE
ncbi:MAG: TonB-dependent receptor [Bacteroidales bacterium]|nr:TonB-dependent receptor [Bacteroidales bacterium]